MKNNVFFLPHFLYLFIFLALGAFVWKKIGFQKTRSKKHLLAQISFQSAVEAVLGSSLLLFWMLFWFFWLYLSQNQVVSLKSFGWMVFGIGCFLITIFL